MSTDEPGLFPAPPSLVPDAPVKDPTSRGERARARIARRIATGTHPLGYLPLHPQACRDPLDREAGPRCGGCIHRGHKFGYPKCQKPFTYGDITTYPRVTGSESSDLRAWWPACPDYVAKET